VIRTRIVPALACAVLVLACVACAGETQSVTTAMRTASVPTTSADGELPSSQAADPASAAESLIPPTLAATGASNITVPVTTSWPSANEGLVIVQISVGGGPSVPVQLDTGSSGLLIDETAVGSEVSTAGGQPFSTSFVSGTVSGTTGTGTVTIGGVSTPDPIEIGLLPTTAFDGSTTGTRGLMGIASANSAGFDGGVFAPNLQLAAPYSAGSTFQIAQNGAGTWTLGTVTPPSGSIDIPLVPASGTTTYPGGGTAWAKDVNLCWTIATMPQACGATDLDLGSPRTALNSTQYSAMNSGNGELAPGQQLSIASPSAANLWSFTTGSTVGQNVVALDELGATTVFNTGIGYFFGRTVAFDYANGQLYLTGQSAAG
jgi:hypothetical protein